MILVCVVETLMDYLVIADVVSLWYSIGRPRLSKSAIALVCTRLNLTWKRSYTMECLVAKLSSTCRCSMCGKPTRSIAIHHRRVYLCTKCGSDVLVSRRQIRDIVLELPMHVQSRVTKTPWSTRRAPNTQLTVARRGPHGGGFLYWRSDLTVVIRQFEHAPHK